MKTQYLLISALTALMLGTSGCESIGDQTTSDGSNGSAAVEVDLAEVDKATVEAEASLEEIYAEIDDIDLGVLDVVGGVSTSNVSSQGLLGIGEKIVKGLDKVVSKFEGLVGKLHGKLDDARAKILAQMAKLDPTNPAHVALIAQLQRLMGEVDEIEARLDEALDRLSEKVGDLSERVDRIIGNLDMGNPLHWIAASELNTIKLYLMEVQDRLAAL